MSATKIFAASTGLRPFSINRVSFTLAFTIATLVITKLVNAFLFCGFNANIYVDLPYGIILFAGYCVMPLLGLAVNRRPRTKRGCCCRVFAITLIVAWLLVVTFFCTICFFYIVGFIGAIDHDDRYIDSRPSPNLAAWDPFNICGNRTNETVRAQFSNAKPTYDVVQRIDLVYKIVNGVAWLFPIVFAGAAFGFFMQSLEGVNEDQRPREDSEAGRPDGDDETCIWTEGEGEPEEFFSAAELEATDECSDEPATIGSDCESPVFGIVDDEVSEVVKSNDGGDNDIELQFFRA